MPAKKILDIPNEVLLCIQDFLTPNDNACLALCNQGLKTLLGTRNKFGALAQQYRDYVSYSGLEAFQFSELLARDHPQYFACHECGKLHSKTSIAWPNQLSPGKRAQTLECLHKAKAESQGLLLRHHSQYDISFYHVQLALEFNRSGKGIPLAAFTHTELGSHTNYSVFWGSDLSLEFTDLFSVDARISSDELLLRTQTWMIAPIAVKNWNIDYQEIFPTACESIPVPFPNIYTSSSQIWELIDCRLNHYGEGTYPKHCDRCGNGKTITLQCHECYMEYQIETKTVKWENAKTRSSPEYIAIIVTRWLSLGSGRSIGDQKWQSHLFERFLCTTQQSLFVPESIRKRFESEPGIPLDKFTFENERKIRSFKEPKNRPEETGIPDERLWSLSHGYEMHRHYWIEQKQREGKIWYPVSSGTKNDSEVGNKDDGKNLPEEAASL